MATMREIAEVLIKINDEEAKAKLPALEKRADEVRKSFEKCFKENDTAGIKKAEKELRKVYKEMNAVRTRTMKIDETMEHLASATPKKLRDALKHINAELNSGHIKRGTKEWEEYNEKLKAVKKELKAIADEQKIVTDAGLSFKDMLDIGGDVAMIGSALLDLKENVADFMRDNVNAFIEYDAELANVRKYTGLSKEGVAELNEEFKKIDTRTSIIDLNKLAEEAGRLGKDTPEEVLGFVKAADIINVALDDLGEGATLTISKLTDIFGDEDVLGTEKSMLAVGSVINDLSQNCTASAPYLTNFAQRMAGVGAQANMTIPQIMAFGAVLDAQGQQVEMSATALSQLTMKMYQDPAKIAKATGMEVEKFTELVKTDANAALIMLLEQLKSIGNMDVLAPVFKEMGADGARASAVLAALAGNVETVKEQQLAANKAYQEANSVIKEFSVQNETEEAKQEKRLKALNEAKVALGEKLLPIMGAFTSTGTLMIKTLNALIDFVKEYKGEILTFCSAFIAYEVVVHKAIIAEKAHLVMTKAVTAAKKIGTVIMGMHRTIVLGCSLAYNKLTGNTARAAAAQRMLNTAQKANLFGAIAAAIVVVIGLFATYRRNIEKTQDAAEKYAKKMKELRDISESTSELAKEELNRVKRLYEVATSDAEAKDKRRIAAENLIKLYPQYFEGLNAEAIIVGKATVKYNELTTSIINSARAKAAANLIEQHEGAILKNEERLAMLKPDYEKSKSNLGTKKKALDDAKRKVQEFRDSKSGKLTSGFKETQIMQKTTIEGELEDYNKAFNEFKAIEKQKTSIENKNKMLEKAIADLRIKYKEAGGGIETIVEGILPDEDSDSDKSNAAQEWRDKEDAINRIAYATGEKTYQEYLDRKNEILLEYYRKQLADTSLSETERLKIEADMAEAEKAILDEKNKTLLDTSLKELDERYEAEKKAATEWAYNIANEEYGNEKILHEKLFQANVEYLKRKKQLLIDSGKNDEAKEVELQLEDLLYQEKLRKQKEYLSEVENFRKEYSKQSPEEQMNAEIEVLNNLHSQGLIKEEEYQKLLKAIKDKYNNKEKFSDGGYGDMLTNMYTSMNELINGSTDNTTSSLEKIGAVAQATWAIAGAALKSYSDYAQASCDAEVAQIERKYDKMIAAAGDNNAKVKQLEEQKEKDIAKVKNKYNKQAQSIEIAQAIASTAMAAINAYSSAAAIPVVGYVLAPIAAAMAVAAGALQIATIKKQHQAQASGYYSGGYTRKSLNDHEEVGVVHANEFVANANATRNRALSPLLNLIDYAQRNNTVGSLTAKDVSQALGYGALLTTSTTTANESVQTSGDMLVVAGTINKTGETLRKLNDRLENGIEAFMVMDGERGFDKKYTDFQKIKNNPKR